jgi:hypothetical protein
MEYFSFALEVLKEIFTGFKKLREWWRLKLPAGKVLGDLLNNKTILKVYIKDLIVPNNTLDTPKLISQEGKLTQINPNIEKVWPEAEARAVAELFNLLGTLGKNKNISIVEMSKGYGEWDNNMIVLGAQAVKCREFYELMEHVAYGVDDNNIYKFSNKEAINVNHRIYGYGIILKAKNPQNNNKPAFLLGGLGILGTEASVYYFYKNIASLGKEFGKKEFGLVIRARISSGEQSATRLKNLDIVFN